MIWIEIQIKNFSLSVRNKDVCEGGLNVSVKPIKTKSKGDKKVMINANTQSIQGKIDGEGEYDNNNDVGYRKNIFEKKS